MKYFLLLLVISNHAAAQFTHIEMAQTPCQTAHCYSSPVVSDSGRIAFIDTRNGISSEHGTALLSIETGPPNLLISNQNELISHVKLDSYGQAVVKIGDQLVRYPNSPITEAIEASNTGPAANDFDWNGDVSNVGFYPTITTCDDDVTTAHQIVKSTIHTYSHEAKSIMTNHRIIADSCTGLPEPFVSTNFVRTSSDGYNKIYALWLPNSTSRLYVHQTGQMDRIMADDVITAEVNNSGLAVWATETNNQISIYIQSTAEFSPPPVLLEQISVPNGFSYNILDLSINDSGDIAFLLRKYHINSQAFSYELMVKKFSTNLFQSMLLTGQTINNKIIEEIRWNHHGINNLGVLTSTVRYSDATEAVLKSLTREAQSIGFKVNNITANPQGIHHLGNVSIHEVYKRPVIIADVPVVQNYEITNSFMRLEDEYFEQGVSDIENGTNKSFAFSPAPPALNVDRLTVYHQITQTSPNITIAPAQTVAIKYLEPSTVCHGGCVVICFTNVDVSMSHTESGPNSMVDVYQRLRSEQLESTSAGNYYLSMYDQNFSAIRDAMFAEPLSMNTFYSLFQSWQPAIEDLLDGNGTYVITSEMSNILNETLDLIERVGNPTLKNLVNHSRNKINLYELSGKTIGDFMANDFENSFEDLIFNTGFESS